MLIPNKFNGYTRDGIRLLHKKDSSAPAPDPRMAEASLRQVALAENQWADYQANDRPWLRSIADQALGIQKRSADSAAALSDYQLGQMKFNDNRYRTVGIPFENQLLSDVNRFDSTGYKEGQIKAAKADVQEAADNAQAESTRGLMRRGVNPGSGMALATRGMQDIGKATALASAANKTRLAADQIGLSTKMSMYGGMKGLAGLGNANAQIATGAMGMGVGAGSGMMGTGTGVIGANNSAFGSAMGGMSAGINGLSQYSQLQQSAANINAQNDPFKTILGAAAGGAGAYGMKMLMASDRRLKTDIRLVGKLDNGLNVYTYRYKAGGPTLMGVMADEVKDLAPQAYVPAVIDGYDAVDYAKL